MADFEDMTRAELVDLCTERGLPTYGAKPALAERLRAAGEAASPEPDPFADEEPDDGAETVDDPDPEEPDGAEDGRADAGPPALPRAAVRAYRATYDVDEWDDDTHDELCGRVVAEAQAAGHRTRGGGHRVGGVDRSHTYEVSVR
jgi:hypothetical protein